MSVSVNIIDGICDRIARAQHGIVSFAAGIPGVDACPDELDRQLTAVLKRPTYREEMVRYPSVRGRADYRQAVERLMGAWQIDAAHLGVIATAGAQQAIDVVMRYLLKAGDRVVVPAPTYPGVIQLLRLYDIDIVEAATDEQGLIVGPKLEAQLRQGAKALYVIPDFDNPTGTCLPESRRSQLLEMTRAHDVWIVEDLAYRDLVYSGARSLPLSCARPHCSTGHVITVGSFSKTVAASLRLGWLAVPREIASPLELVRQGMDISTNNLLQAALAGFIEEHYALHLERIRGLYRRRRDVMAEAICENLPGARFTCPDGGFFFWVELPRGIDGSRLYEDAFERYAVALVPGAGFCLGGQADNYVRLSFCSVNETDIRAGMRRLGAAYGRMARLSHSVCA